MATVKDSGSPVGAVAAVVDTVAVCLALGIDPARTEELHLEMTPAGTFVAHWQGVMVLDYEQRAAVGKIIAGTYHNSHNES